MDKQYYIIVSPGPQDPENRGRDVFSTLINESRDQAIEDRVQVILAGGQAPGGGKIPLVKVLPDNVVYSNVEPADAERIIDQHIVSQRLPALSPKRKLRAANSGRGIRNSGSSI